MTKMVTHIASKTFKDESLCGRNKKERYLKFETWSFKVTCGSCIWLRDKYAGSYPKIPYADGSRPKVIRS